MSKRSKSSFPKPLARDVAPFWVVGLGASAGGLEALSKVLAPFLPGMPLAIIVVQHMSSKHPSLLAQLLRRETKMPVLEIADGSDVRPGYVHIAPPKHNLALENGRFRLIAPAAIRAPTPSVDLFFRSLANAYTSRAIGVILSGTGTDGASGVRALKEMGGHVFAQAPASARYDGMPRAAIDTQVVDAVMPVEELSAKLVRIVETGDASAPGHEHNDSQLDILFRLVRERTGVDLSGYKETTFQRRLHRRVAAVRGSTLSDYLDHVATHPDELDRLLQELLISVTSFFRDPTSYRALEVAVDGIVESKAHDAEIRVWIAGCATGEEAYSIAFLFLDRLAKLELAPKLKIYATDIDPRALDVARRGVYGIKTLSRVSQKQLRAYFLPTTGPTAEIKRKVRDVITFARHDLTRDPPFLRADLVACRNVLIYFRPSLQARVIPVLHYALSATGCLFLGKSESITQFPDLFEPVDKTARIFRRRGASVGVPRMGMVAPGLAATPLPRKQSGASSEHERMLLAAYAPPSVAVTRDGDIVHSYGDLTPYLTFPVGKPALRLPNVMAMPLRTEAMSLLHRSAKEKKIAEGQIHAAAGAPFRIVVHPDKGDATGLFLLAFVSVQGPPAAPPRLGLRSRSGKREDAILKQVEDELTVTRENLQTVMEELETATEEAQALNEEMQSANEELQSANEELETANEELQSTNEELNTVNDELQRTGQELADANADLVTLLGSMTSPLIMFDESLRVLRHNTPARELFSIPSQQLDLGVQALSFPPVLAGLVAHLRASLASGTTVEEEIGDQEQKYLVSITPCSVPSNATTGVLLQLSDVTRLATAQRVAQASLARLHAALEHSPVIIVIADPRGVVSYANPRALSWFSEKRSTIVGQTLWDLFPEASARLVRDRHVAALAADAAVETEDRFLEGRARTLLSIRFVLTDDDGRASVCWQAVDITAREEQREALARSESLSRAVLTAMPASVAVLDSTGHITDVNEAWRQFAEENGAQKPDAWLGESYVDAWSGSCDDPSADIVTRAVQDVLAGRRSTFSLEYPCHSPTDERWFWMLVRPIGGVAPGALVFHTDITTTVKAKHELAGLNRTLEQRIEDRTRALQTAIEELEMFSYSVSHDLRSPLRTLVIYSELLKSEQGTELPAPAIEHLERIAAAASRMGRYLDELLKLSHLVRGDISMSTLDLTVMAGEVGADLRRHDPARHVELVIAQGLSAQGDPHLVRAVLENLLGNAWKYTFERTSPRIEVGWTERDRAFFVRDNGIGFDMAFRDKLFMPFQRLHEDKGIEGHGLGLAAAKRIVSRHGGRLWAEGRPGLGATFYFALPGAAS